MMTLDEYGNLVEKAFKIQNWKYTREESKDKIVFTINFLENSKYRTKCRVFVHNSGICDMEASFPFKCPEDDETGLYLSYYIAACNFSKRYATIRYDFEDGEIVNSYSFDIFSSMTPEFILDKFNLVKEIDEDNYKYIEDLCKQKIKENQEIEIADSDKNDKFKIYL